MNTRHLLTAESLCSTGIVFSISTISPAGEDRVGLSTRNRSSRVQTSSIWLRMAMRMSRSRWFGFLRRVFHYQNGSRSDLGSNPFNSVTWMMLECVALSIQIIVSAYTLAVSKEERPVWPMRIWVSGYASACMISLLLLYWRYWVFFVMQREELSNSDVEQQRSPQDARSTQMMEKCRTCLELFFAIWFVMGNVWVFDSGFGSFHRAPKLHVLCITLLAWNAVSYSFPFILFLLLCCFVPFLSTTLGYNMNMASTDRGASDEQISALPSWKYKEVAGNDMVHGDSPFNNENQECCICLAKYREKEEIRELPCSHIFHLKCVDQWLRIISCCPLCKQGLEK